MMQITIKPYCEPMKIALNIVFHYHDKLLKTVHLDSYVVMPCSAILS